MKKWLTGFLIILLLVVVAFVTVLFNLGSVVKTVVNSYGPDITKTAMSLDKADVSVFEARASLENFIIGNPTGFSSPHAISIGSMLVDIDESTLTKDPLIIDRIEVLQPEITYEIKGTSDNFRTIMDNLKTPGKSKTSGKKEETKSKEGKKVVIRDCILKDIKIKTVAAIAGGDISTTTISEIHLKNIGEKQNGVELAQALLIVLDELYGQMISTDILDKLKNRLKGFEGELDGVSKEVKSIGGQLKGLFD